MGFYTKIRNGKTNVDEADFQTFSENYLASAGVVNMDAGDFLVTQNGTPDRSVLIGQGTAYIPNALWSANQQIMKFVEVSNTANYDIAVGVNTNANPRIDLICLKFDPIVTSDAAGSNVLYAIVVAGTAGVSPVVPSTPSNCIALASVYLNPSYTTIVNSNITDFRIQTMPRGSMIPILDNWTPVGGGTTYTATSGTNTLIGSQTFNSHGGKIRITVSQTGVSTTGNIVRISTNIDVNSPGNEIGHTNLTSPQTIGGIVAFNGIPAGNHILYYFILQDVGGNTGSIASYNSANISISEHF